MPITKAKRKYISKVRLDTVPDNLKEIYGSLEKEQRAKAKDELNLVEKLIQVRIQELAHLSVISDREQMMGHIGKFIDKVSQLIKHRDRQSDYLKGKLIYSSEEIASTIDKIFNLDTEEDIFDFLKLWRDDLRKGRHYTLEEVEK